MPLDADAKPVRILGLDGFDDSIGRRRGYPERYSDLPYRLMVVAVDADLAIAIDVIEARAALEDNGVPMRTAASIAVGHGPRLVFG